jgi:hypothetical protein
MAVSKETRVRSEDDSKNIPSDMPLNRRGVTPLRSASFKKTNQLQHAQKLILAKIIEF